MKSVPVAVALLSIVVLLLAACVPITAVPAESAPAADLSAAALASATYTGIYEEPVTLTDGSWQGEPFVEGGASAPTVTLLPEPQASGDLNADGVADAAVLLVENSGGSGSFVYLAAVLNEGGQPVNAATTLLGDGVQVSSLTIEEGRIRVEALTFAPEDPMCCPSVQQTLVYELQGDTLVLVTE
jgi:hypothetical protein